MHDPLCTVMLEGCNCQYLAVVRADERGRIGGVIYGRLETMAHEVLLMSEELGLIREREQG